MSANYNSSLSFGDKQWPGTRLSMRSGMSERVATNGTVRMRGAQSVTKYDPIIVHGFLYKADVASLRAFYQTNKKLTVLVTCNEDGVQRTCMFAPNAIDVTGSTEGNYSATVYFREV